MFCFTQHSATNIQPHPVTKICGSHTHEYNDNSLLGSDAMYFFVNHLISVSVVQNGWLLDELEKDSEGSGQA